MGEARIFFSGGGHFSKILKKFLKKIAKVHYLTYEISRKFSKICKGFLKKIAKMHYFGIFFKNLTKHSEFFAPLDEKHNLLEMVRKLSTIFKIFLKKIAKNIIVAYFSQKFKKSCVNFSSVWTKNTISWNF